MAESNNTVVLSLTGEEIDILLQALNKLTNVDTTNLRNLRIVNSDMEGKTIHTLKLEWIEL